MREIDANQNFNVMFWDYLDVLNAAVSDDEDSEAQVQSCGICSVSIIPWHRFALSHRYPLLIVVSLITGRWKIWNVHIVWNHITSESFDVSQRYGTYKHTLSAAHSIISMVYNHYWEDTVILVHCGAKLLKLDRSHSEIQYQDVQPKLRCDSHPRHLRCTCIPKYDASCGYQIIVMNPIRRVSDELILLRFNFNYLLGKLEGVRMIAS